MVFDVQNLYSLQWALDKAICPHDVVPVSLSCYLLIKEAMGVLEMTGNCSAGYTSKAENQ